MHVLFPKCHQVGALSWGKARLVNLVTNLLITCNHAHGSACQLMTAMTKSDWVNICVPISKLTNIVTHF